MERARWQEIEAAFEATLGRSPDERAATLAGLDDTVRGEVQQLLAHAEAPDVLPQIVDRSLRRLRRRTQQQVGRRVGPYRLVRQLGQGGMGTVYLAARDDAEYRTEVAIKLLHHGLESKAAIARFRDERQILATLDHPYIVRMIDGGTTEEGLPYLVMEHVAGVPITKFVAGLGVRARVELFRKVCDAVQYAHTRLVVHRDLKPSNILVAPDGTPKLLDFGIAKLLEVDDTGPQREAKTSTGALLLTPQYASPEQIRGAPVTTASDIYSLAAVLFEMLCDRPVFDLEVGGYEAIAKLVDLTPPIPSTVAPAERRGALVGDLDNVLLKALDRDLARRYASVDHFGADLGRHLDGMPVLARAATLSYRAGKFLRRHRLAVALSAAVATALAVATGVSIGQAARARTEARRAEAEAHRAQQRFDDVRALAHTLLFDVDDRIAELAGTTDVRRLTVSRALEYLDGLAADAGDDASLLAEVAQAYVKIGDIQGFPWSPNLGEPAAAMTSYERAAAVLVRLPPDAALDVRAQRERGVCGVAYSTGALTMARAACDDAIAINARLPPTPATYRRALQGYSFLSTIARTVGKPREVAAYAQPALEAAVAWNAIDHSAESRFQLAVVHSLGAEAAELQADSERASRQIGDAIGITRALVDEHPNTAEYTRELALDLLWRGRYLAGIADTQLWMPSMDDPDGATAALKEAMEVGARVVERDPDDVRARSEEAMWTATYGTLISSRDPAAGEAALAQAIALDAQTPVEIRHPGEWFARCSHVRTLALLGKSAVARTEMANVLALTDGAEHRLARPQCEFLLAQAELAMSDSSVAVARLERVAETLRARVALDGDDVEARIGLVDTLELLATHQPAERCAHYDEARSVWAAWPMATTTTTARIASEIPTCPNP